jgi:hypothetical protein
LKGEAATFIRFLENWRGLLKISTAATQDAQLHDVIPPAVSAGNPQVSGVSLGDFHFSGEAIVGPASLNIQSGLSTSIRSNHWLQTRFEPDRSVGFGVRSLLRKVNPL